MIQLILITLLTSLQVFLIVPLIIGHFFKIQGYHITEQTVFNNLIKKLSIKRSTFIKGDKPYGFFYGKWYIGYIVTSENDRNKEQTMYLVISSKRYLEIKEGSEFEMQKNGEKVKQKFMTIFEREGQKWWRNYRERKYNVTKNLKDMELLDFQKKIMNKMNKITKKKGSKSGVFFLYGVPGVGKSLMTFLQASQRDCSFCDSWSPIDSSDQFSKMYTSISPTEEKPLILVLEEVDKILIDLINGNIEEHKHYDKQVTIKSDWNKLLDKINVTHRYPNVTLIMTSNTTLEDLKKVDDSLLRPGRVSKSFHVTKQMLENGLRKYFKEKFFKKCLDEIIELNKKIE